MATNKKFLYPIFSVIFFVIFCMYEYFEFNQDIFSNPLTYQLITKFLLSCFPMALSFFAWHSTQDEYTQFRFRMMIGVLFCLIGDCLIMVNFVLGGVIFIFAQLTFCYTFIKHRKPEKYQFILWLFFALCACSLLIISKFTFSKQTPTFIILCECFYCVVMTFMVALSFSEKIQLNIGCTLFGISDVYLFINALANAPQMSKFFSLLLYYIGIIVLASALKNPKE